LHVLTSLVVLLAAETALKEAGMGWQ